MRANRLMICLMLLAVTGLSLVGCGHPSPTLPKHVGQAIR